MYTVAEGCAFTARGVMYEAGTEVTAETFGSAESLQRAVARNQVVFVPDKGPAEPPPEKTGVATPQDKAGGNAPKQGKQSRGNKSVETSGLDKPEALETAEGTPSEGNLNQPPTTEELAVDALSDGQGKE
jgi:hypothetical protein